MDSDELSESAGEFEPTRWLGTDAADAPVGGKGSCVPNGLGLPRSELNWDARRIGWAQGGKVRVCCV